MVAVTCAEVGNLRKENESQMGKPGAEKSPAVRGFAARSERWLVKAAVGETREKPAVELQADPFRSHVVPRAAASRFWLGFCGGQQETKVVRSFPGDEAFVNLLSCGTWV